jgi:hypothetical protein
MFYDPILAHYDAVASLWEVPRIPLAGPLRGQSFCVKLRAHKKLGSAMGPC